MADKTPQIPVLHLYHNQDGEIYRANVREDKVYCKGEKVAQFSSKSVFTIKVQKKLPKKFKVVIYLDGKANTCKIQKGSEMKQQITFDDHVAAMEAGLKGGTINLDKLQEIPDDIETIFEPLTFKDRVTVVKREIAKQLGKFKPMETWQFAVLIGLIIAAIVTNFIA